nr:MAG TPA: hypothetical protein [Caudoviricetes sp.]
MDDVVEIYIDTHHKIVSERRATLLSYILFFFMRSDIREPD